MNINWIHTLDAAGLPVWQLDMGNLQALAYEDGDWSIWDEEGAVLVAGIRPTLVEAKTQARLALLQWKASHAD